jgi:hypothetical protein
MRLAEKLDWKGLRRNTHKYSTIPQIDSTVMTFLRGGDDSKVCKQVKSGGKVIQKKVKKDIKIQLA